MERLPAEELGKLWDYASEVMQRPYDQQVEDGDKLPYLQRWYATPKIGVSGVMVHRIMRSDKDVLHDHPWDFTSVIVKGEYQEETVTGIWNRPTGSVIHHAAEDAHRLILPQGRECFSVVFTGERRRDWGFHCPKGWVHWTDFCHVGDEGRVGRGCGGMA